jgi:hypothetical protein
VPELERKNLVQAAIEINKFGSMAEAAKHVMTMQDEEGRKSS